MAKHNVGRSGPPGSQLSFQNYWNPAVPNRPASYTYDQLIKLGAKIIGMLPPKPYPARWYFALELPDGRQYTMDGFFIRSVRRLLDALIADKTNGNRFCRCKTCRT